MTKSIKKTLIIFSILLIINTTVNAKEKHSFDQDLSLASNDLKALDVDVGSGSLIIRGSDVNEITVMATIESKKYSSLGDLQNAFDEKMTFTLEKSGSKAELKVLNKKGIFGMNNPNIQVNLDITVPNDINLFVDDGSGSMKVSDINGNVEIDDGSGSIQIKNIIGDLLLDDGSGSLEINNVDGNAIIDDGSGSVKINNISGDLTIDDGSGSINVEQLSGKFKLIDGGSGSVYVNGKKWIEE